MRTTAPGTIALLLLTACVRDDPKQSTPDSLEVVNIGVDIDVDWITQPVEFYELVAVVTIARVEVLENPGGDVIEQAPVDDCVLTTFDPDSNEHPPYTDVEALDVGPSVVLTVGETRLELPAVDASTGRYYVLETDSDAVSLPFPSAVGLELSGEGDGGLAAMSVPDAAWIPEPFTWTSPPALASGMDPEVGSGEDITLEWAGAPSGEQPGFTAWVNNTGSNADVGQFWQQLSCNLTDDGAYTITAAEQGAMEIGDGSAFRTLQLERFAQTPSVPLAEGIVGSSFASQIRRADYFPVAE